MTPTNNDEEIKRLLQYASRKMSQEQLNQLRAKQSQKQWAQRRIIRFLNLDESFDSMQRFIERSIEIEDDNE